MPPKGRSSAQADARGDCGLPSSPSDIDQINSLTSGASRVPLSCQVRQLRRPAGEVAYGSNSGMNVAKGNATIHGGQSPFPGGQRSPEPPTPPMLQRYLREGQQGNDQRSLDRDCYRKGPQGMAEFLHDWEKLWQQALKKTDRIGTFLCSQIVPRTNSSQASQNFEQVLATRRRRFIVLRYKHLLQLIHLLSGYQKILPRGTGYIQDKPV